MKKFKMRILVTMTGVFFSFIYNICYAAEQLEHHLNRGLGAGTLFAIEAFFEIEETDRSLKYFILNRDVAGIFFVNIIVILVLVIGILMINIFRRQKTEQLLRQSQDGYKELLTGIPNTVISLEDGRLKFINQCGINFLGLEGKENITWPELKRVFMEDIDVYMAEELPRQIEMRIKTLHKELKEVEVTIVANNKEAVSKSVIMVIQDISHRRLLYESREREKVRSEFFANVSHEFKTPINLMISTSQLLEQIQDQEDALKVLPKSIRILKQNSYRLIRLVDNIIDITKIEGEGIKLELHNVDIVELTEDITLSTLPYAQSNNIEIIFDTEVEELEIAVDRNLFERIILNLLSNAIKYNKREGKIFVNIYLEGEQVVICVTDTGIGINREMQPYIFETFMQVNKSLIRNVEGSGLGLTLVHALVELHHGKVEVSSKEGEGTTFTLYFPIYTVEEVCQDKVQKILSKHKDRNTTIELSDIYIKQA
jgi:signal transduction histidine kinase